MTPETTTAPTCTVCETSFESMDHYVDHLSDEHEAFELLVGPQL